MPAVRHILTLSCADRPGIVAKVSAALFEGGFNVLEAQQFDDLETGNFFMRVDFDGANEQADVAAFRSVFADLATTFGMTWSLRPESRHKRVVLMVSRFDHCLADLLYRWRSGELQMEVVGIIANYPRAFYDNIDFGAIPFHYLPVEKETKMEQEAQVWETIRAAEADVVVLARYMQVLSDGLVAKLTGRCINIHHSFLPGFKGAKPYHQAHKRGVKLISTKGRSSSRRSSASPTPTRPTISRAKAVTSSGGCSPARSPIICKTACSSTAPRRSCSPTERADLGRAAASATPKKRRARPPA
jgi:formyltetrahydrofolate deformylase